MISVSGSSRTILHSQGSWDISHQSSFKQDQLNRIQPCGSPGVHAVRQDPFCDSAAWIWICVAWRQRKQIQFFLEVGMFSLGLHHQQVLQAYPSSVSGGRWCSCGSGSPAAQGSNFPNTRDFSLSKPQSGCVSQCNQRERMWASPSTMVLRCSNCDVSSAIIFVSRVATWSSCMAGAWHRTVPTVVCSTVYSVGATTSTGRQGLAGTETHSN